jgi:hypothetical protein
VAAIPDPGEIRLKGRYQAAEGRKMAFAQIDNFLFYPHGDKTRQSKNTVRTGLAGPLSALFGLLMGMAALSIIVSPQMTGRPWMLLPRVILLLTFGIISMILLRRGIGDEEEGDFY